MAKRKRKPGGGRKRRRRSKKKKLKERVQNEVQAETNILDEFLVLVLMIDSLIWRLRTGKVSQVDLMENIEDFFGKDLKRVGYQRTTFIDMGTEEQVRFIRALSNDLLLELFEVKDLNKALKAAGFMWYENDDYLQFSEIFMGSFQEVLVGYLRMLGLDVPGGGDKTGHPFPFEEKIQALFERIYSPKTAEDERRKMEKLDLVDGPWTHLSMISLSICVQIAVSFTMEFETKDPKASLVESVKDVLKIPLMTMLITNSLLEKIYDGLIKGKPMFEIQKMGPDGKLGFDFRREGLSDGP